MAALYINECSAQAQFEADNIHEGFDKLLSCMKLLSSSKAAEKEMCYCYSFYTRNILQDYSTIQSFFNQNKDYKRRFQLFQLRDWTAIPKTDCRHKYTYGDNDMTSTSVSEAFEANKAELTILLNFEKSTFEEPSIIVVKDEERAAIPSFCNPEAFEAFLVAQGLVSKPYDIASHRSPCDSETILSDNTQFEVTTYPPQGGRRVYRRIGTTELWYVDNLHYGRDAHIEVFSEASKKQIHVSRINCIDFYRELTKEEKKRSISE